MRIIDPATEILNISHPSPLTFIEEVARTCYKSENLITIDSAPTFVANLISRGHEAMIEHVSVTVKFICDRGVSHELVRHRLASFAQESTRYCNYAMDKFGKELTFIKPCSCPPDRDGYLYWMSAMMSIEHGYFNLLGTGATPQEARSVLPNSLKTEIIMTANLREWRHFFKLRTDKTAHPQMRELTIPLLQKFKEAISIVFDDIQVEAENDNNSI